MYSQTLLSKFDPLIIFPDQKNSTEIKKKETTKGSELTPKRQFIISSFTVTVAKKPRSPKYLIFRGEYSELKNFCNNNYL